MPINITNGFYNGREHITAQSTKLGAPASKRARLCICTPTSKVCLLSAGPYGARWRSLGRTDVGTDGGGGSDD